MTEAQSPPGRVRMSPDRAPSRGPRGQVATSVAVPGTWGRDRPGGAGRPLPVRAGVLSWAPALPGTFRDVPGLRVDRLPASEGRAHDGTEAGAGHAADQRACDEIASAGAFRRSEDAHVGEGRCHGQPKSRPQHATDDRPGPAGSDGHLQHVDPGDRQGIRHVGRRATGLEAGLLESQRDPHHTGTAQPRAPPRPRGPHPRSVPDRIAQAVGDGHRINACRHRARVLGARRTGRERRQYYEEECDEAHRLRAAPRHAESGIAAWGLHGISRVRQA